jgi:pseudomonalisin/xanthomonalisin
LDQLIVAQSNPSDPQFGVWLDTTQILANYTPTSVQVASVVEYLTLSGFTNIQTADNNMLVTATGTAAAVSAAFNTGLAHFLRNGTLGIANISDVMVPNTLADTVLAVLGLQTLDKASVGTYQILNPVQFPIAYDASSLPSAANTAVGIVTAGSMTPVVSDLHMFETESGLPQITPIVVNVGGTSGDTSNTLEWDLDSQNIQAMAGGTLQKMIFYTATSLLNSALTPTFNKAVSDNLAPVINVSLVGCESGNNGDGSMAADDAIFKLAVVQGQTFAVSSGDNGAYACGTVGANGTFGTVQGVSYPASSPYVLAIGGTDLSTNGSAGYLSETAWTYSGGGPSAYEVQPNWQNGTVPGAMRGVPDLAFDSSPGANIYVNGVLEYGVGGTSLAAPLFVGSWARLQSMHANTLGFPAAYLYQYGRIPSHTAFHDVTTGSNGVYSAGAGWDYATGWGSLDVAAFNSIIGGGGNPPAEPVEIVPNAPPTQFTNNSSEPVSVTPSTSGALATYFNFCKTDTVRGQTCHTSTSPNYTFSMVNGSANNFKAQACNTAGCTGFIVSPTTVTYCQNYSCP